MGAHLFKRKSISMLMALCLLLNTAVLFSVEAKASAAIPDTLAASVLSDKAVDFLHKQYQKGDELDGYTAYILTMAGEQLGSGSWSKDGVSLQQKLTKQSDLLANSHLPLVYILANQNENGSFQPYPGPLGTGAILQALAKVKAGISATDAICGQVEAAIAKSKAYFQTPFQQEKWAYQPSGDLNSRSVEALVDAGEDLASAAWTVSGKSLKQDVLDSAAQTAAASDASLSDLAKQVAAVSAVAPSEQALLQTLTDAVLAKKTETADSLYFGASVYDDVLVLSALGKAGQLDRINQAKALAYLQAFQHPHENAWGSATGAAFGSFAPEEADLTAQILQVLSLFDQTGDAGAAIKQAIQDGFLYLKDIQQKDTGAIKHEYDSTYTTAEALLAIQANGDGYKTYNTNESGWAFKSRTKTVAQALLAAVKWNDTARSDRLAQLLLDRHSADSFENSIYSDMLAYIALGEAGKLDPIAQDARAYILKKQSSQPETAGVWGETFDKFYPDFLSTAQAMRALTYLPYYTKDADAQAAYAKGAEYLKGLQQADGGVYNPSDDTLVDTAEAVVSLKRAGLHPNDWQTAEGKTPASYVLQQSVNPDGSFGGFQNSFAAAEALYAFTVLGTAPKKSFADVTQANFAWAVGPIETMAGAGGLNGIDGTRYEPARSITRAEFAAALTRVMGVLPASGTASKFSDVSEGEWYTDIINAAVSQGWIRGYEDGTFRPGNPITREEMAVILVRANQWTASAAAVNFTDKADIYDWAVKEVAAVVDKGVVKGFDDGSFRPKNSATRAEAAVMLYRMVGIH